MRIGKGKVMLCMILALLVSGATVISNKAKAGNTTANYKFDFGGKGVASGYTGVSAGDAYSASKGFGFNTPGKMKNVTASGTGACSDAVLFTTSDVKGTNTFNVDLPKGLYQITVTLGNTTRTSVAAEGMLQLINLTGNNATETFQMPVTDGQLNILATAGKTGYAFTMSALEIKQISTVTTMKPTIWICGDSTVCNYYPKDTSTLVGWGQMLGNYVDKSKYQIRNMAASGQYAQGFINAGQFEAIKTYGKTGDIYIISIGINDTNYSNSTGYYNAITAMTKEAKAKGMTVVLVKQQGRASDVTNHPTLTGRWFGSVLDTVGKEQNVQVLDLFNLAFAYFKSIGQTATTALYYDDLHFKREGASVLAKLVAKNMKYPTSTITKSPTTTAASSVNSTTKVIATATTSVATVKPVQTATPGASTTTGNTKPVIYIIGDSTACNYSGKYYPQTGWGQVIGNYMKSNVTIANHAIGGRSSKMFYNQGRWATVNNLLKEGDYVFIQFGINDGNYNNAERYAPTSDGTYQKYMKIFIEDTLKKKAIPVILTPTLGLASYQNKTFVGSYANYCTADKELAKAYNITCLDINSLMVVSYNQIGYDAAYYYHMISTSSTSTDKTHFTAKGADAVAKIIANAVKGSKLGLANHVQ